jgi:mRNA-degrading endonuclease toxin of MazEF toxin-antitoxin module
MDNIYYTCLFVEDRVTLLQKFKPVHKHVVAHHSTISFKPDSLESLNGFRVGHTLKIKVLGRVLDEFADAILIENNLSKKQYPHITISHVDGVERNYSDTMIEKAVGENKVEYFKDEIYLNLTVGWVDMGKKEYRDDKNFEKWMVQKENLNNSQVNKWCRAKEVWWCSVGQNVGYEEDGKDEKRLRPVVVLRNFGFHTALVVSLTTSQKNSSFHFDLGIVAEKRSFAIISQIKLVDTKRLFKQIDVLERGVFDKLKIAIKNLF